MHLQELNARAALGSFPRAGKITMEAQRHMMCIRVIASVTHIFEASEHEYTVYASCSSSIQSLFAKPEKHEGLNFSATVFRHPVR